MSSDTQLQDFKNKKIEGYANTWSAFAEEQYSGKRYFLLENDEYGDETSYLFYVVAANKYEVLVNCLIVLINVFMLHMHHWYLNK